MALNLLKLDPKNDMNFSFHENDYFWPFFTIEIAIGKMDATHFSVSQKTCVSKTQANSYK
jgi:hypothetical protein